MLRKIILYIIFFNSAFAQFNFNNSVATQHFVSNNSHAQPHVFDSSLTRAALDAETASIVALTYDPNSYKTLEHLAQRYFTVSGWQDFMTPKLQNARKLLNKNNNHTNVIIQSWPKLRAQKNSNILLAAFEVKVNLYDNDKQIAQQKLQLLLQMQPNFKLNNWQVVHWSSRLL